MASMSTSAATQGLSAQLQTTSPKTAHNAQKQEGNSSASLSKAAAESSTRAPSDGKGHHLNVAA